MDITQLLARFLGTVYVVVPLAIFLNQNFFKRLWQSVVHQPFLLVLSSFLGTIIGFFIIQFHNIWVKDWEVIITLLGWMIFISGVFRLLFPNVVIAVAKKIGESDNLIVVNVIATLVFVLGLFLLYKGFY